MDEYKTENDKVKAEELLGKVLGPTAREIEARTKLLTMTKDAMVLPRIHGHGDVRNLEEELGVHGDEEVHSQGGEVGEEVQVKEDVQEEVEEEAEEGEVLGMVILEDEDGEESETPVSLP